jgi:hypothetical protein
LDTKVLLECLAWAEKNHKNRRHNYRSPYTAIPTVQFAEPPKRAKTTAEDSIPEKKLSNKAVKKEKRVARMTMKFATLMKGGKSKKSKN